MPGSAAGSLNCFPTDGGRSEERRTRRGPTFGWTVGIVAVPVGRLSQNRPPPGPIPRLPPRLGPGPAQAAPFPSRRSVCAAEGSIPGAGVVGGPFQPAPGGQAPTDWPGEGLPLPVAAGSKATVVTLPATAFSRVGVISAAFGGNSKALATNHFWRRRIPGCCRSWAGGYTHIKPPVPGGFGKLEGRGVKQFENGDASALARSRQLCQ
jgi:hypothetical protein